MTPAARRSPSTDAPIEGGPPAPPPRNEVGLRGRLTAAPLAVTLPSGDLLWRFRVSVERDARLGRRRGATPTRRAVDALDCVTSTARIAARLSAAGTGAVVEVDGVLTRRFWRAPGGGPASRCEVVVTRAAVVSRTRTRAAVPA